MAGPSRNRKIWIVVATVLSCAAVALTIGLAFPTPIANPALGADWQCHRSAGIVTTCQHVSHAAPTLYRPIVRPVSTSRV